jgi:hypothetical protein
MSFAELASLVGTSPEAPIPVDWDAVESWLKLRLPSDYKAVASAYGPLGIGDGIGLHTPLHDDFRWDWDYTRWLQITHRDCRGVVRLDMPAEVPAFHPARGGLLAWGTTPRADPLFWDTSVSTDPNEWTTVLFHREFPYVGNSPWHRYSMSMTEFVVAAIRAGIDLGTPWGFGPLPPTVSRPPHLGDARPWTAPVRRPVSDSDAERRAALRKGKGLDTLVVLVTPPAQPHTGETTWEQVAEELGTPLPSDYRALMERYGAGEWRGWLNFFGRDELAEKVEVLTGIYRDLRAQFPEFHPLAAWPEPGGFLPFALSIDGDQLCWLTVGAPDTWPLILIPRDGEPGSRWRTGLADGLLRWSRGYAPPGMPDPDPLDDLLELARFKAAEDENLSH